MCPYAHMQDEASVTCYNASNKCTCLVRISCFNPNEVCVFVGHIITTES